MDKQEKPVPQKIQKIVHFHTQIGLPEGATTVPYKPLHTTTSNKSKKTKKLQEFTYYRSQQNKDKIMKVLYKNDDIFMNMGYYPFTDPLDQIQSSSTISSKNMHRVIKTQAAYIGHRQNEIVLKKMIEVKLGQDGNQFDTIGDNFEIIKVDNNQRFQQFLRILKTHPKANQISIRVVIDESVVGQPKIIDYEFFKREAQIKNTNLKFINAKAPQKPNSEKKQAKNSNQVQHQQKQQKKEILKNEEKAETQKIQQVKNQ